jgi:hypothetical protein
VCGCSASDHDEEGCTRCELAYGVDGDGYEYVPDCDGGDGYEYVPDRDGGDLYVRGEGEATEERWLCEECAPDPECRGCGRPVSVCRCL